MRFQAVRTLGAVALRSPATRGALASASRTWPGSGPSEALPSSSFPGPCAGSSSTWITRLPNCRRAGGTWGALSLGDCAPETPMASVPRSEDEARLRLPDPWDWAAATAAVAHAAATTALAARHGSGTSEGSKSSLTLPRKFLAAAEESRLAAEYSGKRDLAGGCKSRLQKMQCQKKAKKKANKCNPKNNVDMGQHQQMWSTTNDAEGPSCRYHTGLNLASIPPFNMSIFVVRSCIGQPMAVFCIHVSCQTEAAFDPCKSSLAGTGPSTPCADGGAGLAVGAIPDLHLSHGLLLLFVARSGGLQVSSTFPFVTDWLLTCTTPHAVTSTFESTRRMLLCPRCRCGFGATIQFHVFSGSSKSGSLSPSPSVSSGVHICPWFASCQKTRKLKVRQMQQNAKKCICTRPPPPPWTWPRRLGPKSLCTKSGPLRFSRL